MTRAVELSVSQSDPDAVATLDTDVGQIVGDLEALRLAIEETHDPATGARPGVAQPGGLPHGQAGGQAGDRPGVVSNVEEPVAEGVDRRRPGRGRTRRPVRTRPRRFPTTTAGVDRSLLGASAAPAVGTALSRATGLLRVSALTAALGLTEVADIYNLANTTPNILYELVLGGVLSSTLVPMFIHGRSSSRTATGTARASGTGSGEPASRPTSRPRPS